MDGAGQRLRKKRENLGLKYRDVEEASNILATRKNSDEYVINLSRLSDIENKGTVPSIFRLYSLCTIYRADMTEVLDWYGVSLASQSADAQVITLPKTHVVGFTTPAWGEISIPISIEPGIDLRRTHLLSRLIQKWGKMPISLLSNLDLKTRRYGFVGADDWRMFPIIYPESLVLIDETRKKIALTGWKNDHDRPIYFLEHRSGYFIGWCSVVEKNIVVLTHPASKCEPLVLAATETDILGQVTGVANQFDLNRLFPNPL